MRELILGADPEGRPVVLPADRAWEKLAVVGISGSGKSYAAGRIVEQMIHAGVPVSVIDPVGIFWGLRSGASGRAEGGIPIAIYGGMHGDCPVLPDPEEIAERFALYGESNVLDVSELTMEEMHDWVGAYAEALMAPGIVPFEPCHVVLEEAPILVPQSGSYSKNQRRCKASLAHLWRVGRNRGYGGTVIAQRAAAVDKNLLTQCGSLLLMRLAAMIDRRAITEWIANNAANAERYMEMIPSLSELPNGVGWLWSPAWAETFTKVKVSSRETYHPGPMAKGFVDMLPFDVEPPRERPRAAPLLAGARRAVRRALLWGVGLAAAIFFIVALGISAILSAVSAAAGGGIRK